MACATCGNGRSRARVLNREPAPQSASMRMRGAVAPADEQDTILVQFTGHGSRTIQAGGGVSYRFGEDAEHRVRRVRKSHAPLFSNRSMFQVVEDLGDVMELEGQASGSPNEPDLVEEATRPPAKTSDPEVGGDEPKKESESFEKVEDAPAETETTGRTPRTSQK